MTIQDFVNLVEKSDFLGRRRQDELLENATLMTPHERDFLSGKIVQTGEKIHAAEMETVLKLEKIETALKSFRREELPKMRREKEREEEKGTGEKAEELLKNF